MYFFMDASTYLEIYCEKQDLRTRCSVPTQYIK